MKERRAAIYGRIPIARAIVEVPAPVLYWRSAILERWRAGKLARREANILLLYTAGASKEDVAKIARLPPASIDAAIAGAAKRMKGGMTVVEEMRESNWTSLKEFHTKREGRPFVVKEAKALERVVDPEVVETRKKEAKEALDVLNYDKKAAKAAVDIQNLNLRIKSLERLEQEVLSIPVEDARQLESIARIYDIAVRARKAEGEGDIAEAAAARMMEGGNKIEIEVRYNQTQEVTCRSSSG